MVKSSKKTFTELGYTHMDTAEIVTLLNRLLSNYSVYQQKLRNFHWSALGQDFFQLYGHFEAAYQRSVEETGKIAERIRLFGQKPAGTFTAYLKHSAIEEEEETLTSFEMVKTILGDIRVLLEIMEKCIDAAREIKDNGTVHLLQSFIYNMEKEHWMLTSWIKQNV